MTRHLLQRGRKRIAFVAAQLDPRSLQRLAGWRRELALAGLYGPSLEWLNPAPSSMALGGDMFNAIMKARPATDAIFFCNDDLAQGALLAALHSHIAVPSTWQWPDSTTHGQRPDVASPDHRAHPARRDWQCSDHHVAGPAQWRSHRLALP